MSGRSACRGRAGAASAAGTHIGERLYPFIQGGVRQLDLASRRHSQWRRLLKRVLHAALLLGCSEFNAEIQILSGRSRVDLGRSTVVY